MYAFSVYDNRKTVNYCYYPWKSTDFSHISTTNNLFICIFAAQQTNNIQKDMIVGREKEIELLKGLLEEGYPEEENNLHR